MSEEPLEVQARLLLPSPQDAAVHTQVPYPSERASEDRAHGPRLLLSL